MELHTTYTRITISTLQYLGPHHNSLPFAPGYMEDQKHPTVLLSFLGFFFFTFLILINGIMDYYTFLLFNARYFIDVIIVF